MDELSPAIQLYRAPQQRASSTILTFGNAPWLGM